MNIIAGDAPFQLISNIGDHFETLYHCGASLQRSFVIISLPLLFFYELIGYDASMF